MVPGAIFPGVGEHVQLVWYRVSGTEVATSCHNSMITEITSCDFILYMALGSGAGWSVRGGGWVVIGPVTSEI